MLVAGAAGFGPFSENYVTDGAFVQVVTHAGMEEGVDGGDAALPTCSSERRR